MILTQDTSGASFQIRAYQPGSITVNDQAYQQSLIIAAEQLIADWKPQSLAELTAADWAAVLTLKPGIIILGTGKRFQLPHPSLLAPVYEQKIGIESMDTGAACRTYTALASEGRRVVAALLIN